MFMNFITLMEGYFYRRNKNKHAVSGVFGAGRANENRSFPGKIHTPQYYHFGDLRNCFLHQHCQLDQHHRQPV